MKKLILLLLFVFYAFATFSQAGNYPGKITGVLVDSATASPIPFATVALMEGEKVIKGMTTEENGKFSLSNVPTGNFILILSFIGYRSANIPVELSNEKSDLDLGKISLASESKTLDAVTIKGEKPLVEDKGDRLVYNAENDISNAGGTAADVLRKVPGITVDLNGNVQMRGNSNIKVLINGKPSGMMARNLADALKQMPANLIKSVEVISNPGAKYDAEGSGGVINIITKKGLQGFNGSVNASVGNFNSGAGTTLSFKKNKLGISLSANGYQYRNYFENNSIRTSYSNMEKTEIVNVLNQRFVYDNTGRGGYGEMSIDYDFDSTSRLNFSANIWGGKYPNNSIHTYRLTDKDGNVDEAYRNESKFLNPYGNGQLDLGFTKTLKKPEQEFSLLGQFSRMPDNYFYTTTRYSPEEEIELRQESMNYSRNKEYTAQTDYVHPITINGKKDTTSIKLEIGAKGIFRDIGSEYRVREAKGEDGPFEEIANQSNEFDYFQTVYSGYTSVIISNKRKWSLNAGLRLEHTTIEGDFISTNTKISTYYRNLIPSFTLSKGIKSHTLKISYNQRIQRPMIWFLNPWVNESDPKNIWKGNPDLKPELSHSAELGYSLNTERGTSVNTALYFRMVDNAIDFPSKVDTTGAVTTTPQNIAKRKNYGININLAAKPNKNWNINGGGDWGIIDLENPALNQSKRGSIWSLNINSTYKLPKGFSVQANGNYFSGWINLMENHSAYYWYGISGKYEFMKEKASVTLNFNSPFNKGISQKREQSGQYFTTNQSSFFLTRSVRLTFEWRFGQMNEGGTRKSKKINNDDKSGR